MKGQALTGRGDAGRKPWPQKEGQGGAEAQHLAMRWRVGKAWGGGQNWQVRL